VTRIGVLMLLMTILAGCETIGGFGRDVEAGGEAIQGASDDVQGEL